MDKEYVIQQMKRAIKILKKEKLINLRGFHFNVSTGEKENKPIGQIDIYWGRE